MKDQKVIMGDGIVREVMAGISIKLLILMCLFSQCVWDLNLAHPPDGAGAVAQLCRKVRVGLGGEEYSARRY